MVEANFDKKPILEEFIRFQEVFYHIRHVMHVQTRVFTVEPLFNGHFGTSVSVLNKEVEVNSYTFIQRLDTGRKGGFEELESRGAEPRGSLTPKATFSPVSNLFRHMHYTCIRCYHHQLVCNSV